MILAELEVYHSRPVAPTRRLALGRSLLPVDPAPGFGGILLGAVVAEHLAAIDPDLVGDLRRLTLQLEHGHRVAQPRLRHRFQTDRIGLTRSSLRLRGDGHRMRFDFEDKAAPAQYVLAAVYAAGAVAPTVRPGVLATVRAALDWVGFTITGSGPDTQVSLYRWDADPGTGGSPDPLATWGPPDCVLQSATGPFADTGQYGGIRFYGNRVETHSVVMRSKSGTVRYIESVHHLDWLDEEKAID